MTSGSLTTQGSAASLARPGVLSLARLLLMPMAASAPSCGWTASPDAAAEGSLGQSKAAIYDPNYDSVNTPGADPEVAALKNAAVRVVLPAPAGQLGNPPAACTGLLATALAS